MSNEKSGALVHDDPRPLSAPLIFTKEYVGKWSLALGGNMVFGGLSQKYCNIIQIVETGQLMKLVLKLWEVTSVLPDLTIFNTSIWVLKNNSFAS